MSKFVIGDERAGRCLIHFIAVERTEICEKVAGLAQDSCQDLSLTSGKQLILLC